MTDVPAVSRQDGLDLFRRVIAVDFVSPVKGILAAHLVEPGTTVGVGEDIVVVASDDQDYEAFKASKRS